MASSLLLLLLPVWLLRLLLLHPPWTPCLQLPCWLARPTSPYHLPDHLTMLLTCRWREWTPLIARLLVGPHLLLLPGLLLPLWLLPALLWGTAHGLMLVSRWAGSIAIAPRPVLGCSARLLRWCWSWSWGRRARLPWRRRARLPWSPTRKGCQRITAGRYSSSVGKPRKHIKERQHAPLSCPASLSVMRTHL